MDAVRAEADERERRVFVENLLAWIKVFPDHLEVKVVGSPPINVLLSEVGLKVPETPLGRKCQAARSSRGDQAIVSS
jgi:hypothetical protein